MDDQSTLTLSGFELRHFEFMRTEKRPHFVFPRENAPFPVPLSVWRSFMGMEA